MIIYKSNENLKNELRFKRTFRSEREMKKYIFRKWNKYYKKRGKQHPPFRVRNILILEERKFYVPFGWVNAKYVCINRCGGDTYIDPMGIGYCIDDQEENAKRILDLIE